MDTYSFKSIDLLPSYVNRRRIAALVGAPRLSARAGVLRPPSLDHAEFWFNEELSIFKDALLEWLQLNEERIYPLDKLLLSDEAAPGRMFWAFRDFYGRGLHSQGQAEMHATYEFASKTQLRLLLDRLHVAPGSPSHRLTGHQTNIFVFGIIERRTAHQVVSRPVFIGDLVERGDRAFEAAPELWTSHGEIQPDRVDSFSRIRDQDTAWPSDLKPLWSISEQTLKIALCEIIGEPNVPKDWGGERSDVFTTHLRVDGFEVPAAFVLKGPAGQAKPPPMTFRMLGKRGDQIDRLFTEPADLLVLQYCQSVTGPVRNAMRAYSAWRRKRFCIVDGYSTVRILRAYGKCGFESKPRDSQAEMRRIARNEPPDDDIDV